MFAGSCRFVPSCSAYAVEAVDPIRRLRGSWLAMRRLARCHPLGGTRLRPRPRPSPARLIVHGKTRSSRGRSVVHRPVWLPGDVSRRRSRSRQPQAARHQRPGSSRPVAADAQRSRSRPQPSRRGRSAAAGSRDGARGRADDREIVVENDAVRAVFSTAGGVLKSWRLKRYAGSDGQPLDLVPPQASAGSAAAVHADRRRRGGDGDARAGAVQAERRVDSDTTTAIRQR